MSELVIDEKNFGEYFKEVNNTNRPQKGEIIARWTGMANLVEGHLKKDLLYLLETTSKAEAATQVLKKLAHATEKDSIRLCKDLCKDLCSMTKDEVEKKEHSYQVEFFYYTKQEYIPLDDPHWEVISLINLDEFLDIAGQRLQIKMEIKEDNTTDVHCSFAEDLSINGETPEDILE
ncbi:MAG: hypothetical protein WCG45_06300 [bacterium]